MDPLFPASPRPLAPPLRRRTHMLVRAAVLLLPAALLALGAVYFPEGRVPYWIGAGLVALLALTLLPQPRLAQPSTGLAVIALYILAQVWLWNTNSAYRQHWYPHLAI